MRLRRPAVPVLAVGIGLATITTPAYALFSGELLGASDAVFSSPTTGVVTVEYWCGDDADPTVTSDRFVVFLDQEDPQTLLGGHADGSGLAVCDGQRRSADITLTLGGQGLPLVEGPASIYATIPGQPHGGFAGSQVRFAFDPTPTPTPTPTPEPAPKATVALTTNASPESVTKGKKITVKGSVRRAGKKVALTTVLEFRADNASDYSRVKSVTSSKSGLLSTSLAATRSGSFRFTYGGDATTEAAVSTGDHIVVVAPAPAKPKPKAYKNCSTLVKVYPHGVGRSGARDKGGNVTDFARDSATYGKNKKSDRDKDGIACER